MSVEAYRRTDQEKRAYFRSSERVIRVNGAWYFASREGDHGPYRSEAQAVIEAQRYVQECVELATFADKRAQSMDIVAQEYEASRRTLDETVAVAEVVPLHG